MQIYLVGGAIRDALLGRAGSDRDWVVVGATPEQMAARGFLPVGRDFPVFLHPETREEYALARTERKSAPGYRGFVVHAAPDVTLEQDLARRDLTINAIALPADKLVAACRRAVELGDEVAAVGTLSAAWHGLQLRGPFQVAMQLVQSVEAMAGLGERALAIVDWVAASTLDSLGKRSAARRKIESGLARARSQKDARPSGCVREPARFRSCAAPPSACRGCRACWQRPSRRSPGRVPPSPPSPRPTARAASPPGTGRAAAARATRPIACRPPPPRRPARPPAGTPRPACPPAARSR